LRVSERGHRRPSGPREFFEVRPVSDALAGFRPARRSALESVGLNAALGRIPAEAIVSPHALPGFTRATVDGFAVRAADTYGASEEMPSYLELAGEALMGRPPEAQVRPGSAVAIATGAPLPPGADAVVMVEHTQAATSELIEVLRPAAPGDGVVGADEDAAAGGPIARAGRALRAHDVGMLAAAGITELVVHARPRVAVVSTGDELVPHDTAALVPGQVRDAIWPALAALVREAGGEPVFAGIVPDDGEALAHALRSPLRVSDLLVVSAGSSVGARDQTAAAIASLGEPGIWCHGLSVKPGKPTLLAEAGEVPVIGLPGNPRSALVVFRLIGVPLVRLVGGCVEPPPEPTVSARLARDLPSAGGRLDVVQVRLEEDMATPLFGSSSLLSVLTAADGYLTVPEPATGLAAGSEVDVTLYR
jgi:molybdopterin molybdotransferase